MSGYVLGICIAHTGKHKGRLIYLDFTFHKLRIPMRMSRLLPLRLGGNAWRQNKLKQTLFCAISTDLYS